MTPSELKMHVEIANHETHFFDRKTMRFFGDTMKNYGVRLATIPSNYDGAGNYVKNGVQVECWELYRKRPVKHGLKTSAYFDTVHFRQVFRGDPSKV